MIVAFVCFVLAQPFSYPLPSFPAGSPWQADVTSWPLVVNSSSITAWLVANGGWGFGRLQADYSIQVLYGDCNTPRIPYTEATSWAPGALDCDRPATIPVPLVGAVEGGITWDPSCGGDCHYVFYDMDSKLYEAVRLVFPFASFRFAVAEGCSRG